MTAPDDDRVVRRVIALGAIFVVPALTIAPLAALVDDRVARPAMVFAIGGIVTGGAWLAGWWCIPAARRSIAAALCAMTLTAFAAALAPHSQPDWDFINAYQLPADRFQAGVDPWEVGETTNPPTYAQTLGLAHAAVRAVVPGATHERAWFWVFYVHQGVQQWLLAAMLLLLLTLTRRAGLSTTAAATISALLMLLNDPLRETLARHQVNLLIVVIMLAAVELAPRRPWAAGPLAAAGAAIKLYPLIVFGAWLLRSAWAPLAAGAITLMAIIAVSVPEWTAYFGYLRTFERPPAVRDAGLHSLVINVFGAGDASFWIWLCLCAGLAGWMLMQRRRAGYRQHLDDWALMAATPIVFPLSWAHHFLFVTPLAAALAAEAMTDAAGRAGDHRPLIMVAVTTALVIPAFEIFPLGISRLAGAIMLLGAWSRVRVAA